MTPTGTEAPTTTTETPAAATAAPAAPEPSRFEQKIAELRGTLDAPAADPAAAVEGVPEAGDAAEIVDGPEAAAPAETTPGGDEAIVAKLPGRRPDDPEFELPLDKAALEAAGIDPQEAVERLNQLKNEGMRRQQYVEAMEGVSADRAELDGIEQAMRTDPAGFLTQKVNPAVQEAVAETLLRHLPEEAWDRLMEKCAAWDSNRVQRRTEATEATNKRLQAQLDQQNETRQRQAEAGEVKNIGTAIADLIPEGMEQAKGDRFFDYAVLQLQKYISDNNINRLDAAKVPQILADLGVLQDFGLDVEPTPGAKPAPAKSAPVKTAAVPARAKAPVQTGETVRKRVETRKAAATAPAGAGSGTTGTPLPKGQKFEERLKSLRERFGL